MTDDNNVLLGLLGKQMERMIEEQGRVRDSIDVLTGIVIRLEGAVNGLTLEITGLRRMRDDGTYVHRLDEREGDQ